MGESAPKRGSESSEHRRHHSSLHDSRRIWVRFDDQVVTCWREAVPFKHSFDNTSVRLFVSRPQDDRPLQLPEEPAGAEAGASKDYIYVLLMRAPHPPAQGAPTVVLPRAFARGIFHEQKKQIAQVQRARHGRQVRHLPKAKMCCFHVTHARDLVQEGKAETEAKAP